MKKVIKYHLASEYEIFAFDKEINSYIEHGWELYGSPFVCSNQKCQAMVKYENTNTKEEHQNNT